jgi:hypothetical protein
MPRPVTTRRADRQLHGCCTHIAIPGGAVTADRRLHYGCTPVLHHGHANRGRLHACGCSQAGCPIMHMRTEDGCTARMWLLASLPCRRSVAMRANACAIRVLCTSAVYLLPTLRAERARLAECAGGL